MSEEVLKKSDLDNLEERLLGKIENHKALLDKDIEHINKSIDDIKSSVRFQGRMGILVLLALFTSIVIPIIKSMTGAGWLALHLYLSKRLGCHYI